ncbi:MAG: ECF transporter S component, partial [Lachnospiraceae bacterium]|nr:ECF transporter S component [Lachnospiraceae bacterium]
VYIIYAPKTFFLKFCIGLITGLIAHKIGKITSETDHSRVVLWTSFAAAGGLLFNVIFDPLIGYCYKRIILGKPAADVTLAWNIASTSINAVTSAIVSVLVYLALLPALKKAGLFFTIGQKKDAG